MKESQALFETGENITLKNKRGTILVGCKGIFERGEFERESGETTRAATAKFITAPTVFVAMFQEGDSLERENGEKFTILDAERDEFQTRFLLS